MYPHFFAGCSRKGFTALFEGFGCSPKGFTALIEGFGRFPHRLTNGVVFALALITFKKMGHHDFG